MRAKRFIAHANRVKHTNFSFQVESVSMRDYYSTFKLLCHLFTRRSFIKSGLRKQILNVIYMQAVAQASKSVLALMQGNMPITKIVAWGSTIEYPEGNYLAATNL
jgi:hypothetical protein